MKKIFRLPRVYSSSFVASGDGKYRKFGPFSEAVRNPIVRGREIRTNPKEVWDNVWSTRMFVGLSVNDKPTYSVSSVVAETRRFLRRVKYKEDSSFVSQTGVYTHQQGKHAGQVVQEQSVQIVIFDESGDKDSFLKIMQALAEHLAKYFKQEAVIVQILFADVVRTTWKVTP